MIYNQIYELQNEIKKLVDEKFQEKDKEFGLLLADRDKLEIYRHNRLKKSDFEIEVEFGSSDWTGYRRNKYILKNSSKYESLED